MTNTRSKVLLKEPFSSAWAGKDVFASADALHGKVYRALEGRTTLRTAFAGKGYFVKIHKGIGWKEIFKNLMSLRSPVLGARNELVAIERVTAANVPTMRAVAFAERGCNPARQESFLITEELAPTVALDAALMSAELRPTPMKRLELIREVARMTRDMHAAGVNHRDLYLCHFLLHTGAGDAVSRLSLIDLHRAQCRAFVPLRWRNKDLSALYFSALECRCSFTDQARFLTTYFGKPLREIMRTEARLMRHLEAEGKRLRERYARKYAPKVADLK